MFCESCRIEHNGSYGSGRFCGAKCARGFATKLKREEINKKVSAATKGISRPHTHIQPKHSTETRLLISKSVSAAMTSEVKMKISTSCLGRKPSLETQQKLCIAMQKRIAEGRHNGWPTRTKLKPSFAECYFIEFFRRRGIQFEPELPCGKFFIDFAFENEKIALEVDGSQHKRDTYRIAKDAEKDEFLKSQGWLVYRIDWSSLHTPERKAAMLEKAEQFLAFLRNSMRP